MHWLIPFLLPTFVPLFVNFQLACLPASFIITFYYLARSASGQDEPSHAIWLATRAGKMAWSYLVRLKLPAASCKKNFLESQIINPLLIKLFWSRWLDIGLAFLRIYGPQLRLGPWTRKKKELGQYPVIRTSHLVNTHTSVLVPLYVSSFVFLLQVCNCFFHSVTYILVNVNKLILLITYLANLFFFPFVILLYLVQLTVNQTRKSLTSSWKTLWNWGGNRYKTRAIAKETVPRAACRKHLDPRLQW